MLFRKLSRLLATPLLAFGVLLHLGPADSWHPGAAVFYALPLPVLAGGWLFMAFMWRWTRLPGLVCAMLALGCAAWWFAVSYRDPVVHSNHRPDLKVLFWNMAHRGLPSGDLAALLQEHAPDVTGLVEVGLRHGDPNPLARSLPAGYTALKLDHGMAVVVRGTVKMLRTELLPSSSKFSVLEAVVDGALWRVFIVDGVSRPTASRKDVLDRVLSEARGGVRTVVVGDFNTPIESALFASWEHELHHAFNEAGSGFRETWPRWVPVLTIDHVWSSADAPPLRAQRVWRGASDHAALVVELGSRAR